MTVSDRGPEVSDDGAGGTPTSCAGGTYEPIVARTRTVHEPVGPTSYDCVKLIVVRSGSATLFSEFGEKSVRPGDAVVLCPNVLCGSNPADHITVTTIYLDTDYVFDQLFWQYAGLVRDRLDARSFVKRLYTDPAQVLHLGQDRSDMLAPWLDQLVTHSLDGGFAVHCHRMQALWFAIVDVVAPIVKVSPVRLSSQRRSIRPAVPRNRRFAPLRADVRRVAELLSTAPAKRWTLPDLAKQAHLSPSRLSRLFVEAYGKTPWAYLTMIRAERLATSLRETDMPIETAMREVGWRSRGHAARVFRQCVGVSPSKYRKLTQQPSRQA